MHSDPIPPQRHIARWIAIAVGLLILFTLVLLVAIWPKPQAPTESPATTTGLSQSDTSTLHRAQQNTQRKNDAIAIAAGTEEFMSNNMGSLPSSTSGTDANLLLCGSECTGTDSSNAKIKLGIYKAQDISFQGWYDKLKVPDANTVYLVRAGVCTTDETGLSARVGSTRELAILFALDAGDGSMEQHCQGL